MVGTSFEANKFHMVLRSHVRRRESITILPEEIIFMILVLLPADILCNVVRYVCRQWYALIQDPRFVREHSLLSHTTLLLHSVSIGPDSDVYRLLDVRECDVRLPDFKFQLPSRVLVRSACNGLLLMEDIVRKIYYLGNPITRRILALPKLSTLMRTNSRGCSLAFEASSKVYKAVVVFVDPRLISRGESRRRRCAILTVGVDKAWRVLNLTHVEEKNKDMGFLMKQQLGVTGFIYWVSECDPHGFALDIKSEIMNHIPVPYVHPKITRILPKGNSISLLVSNPDLSMEVWVLDDLNREQWVKSSHIGCEPIRNDWENFASRNNYRTHLDLYILVSPTTWLGNGDKILFSCVYYGYFIVYDLNTCACFEVDVKHDGDHNFVPFIPSLAWV